MTFSVRVGIYVVYYICIDRGVYATVRSTSNKGLAYLKIFNFFRKGGTIMSRENTFRLLVVCLVLLLLDTPVAGEVITVEKDGSGDYTTIGEAVAAAESTDTIVVGPGVYPEELYVECSVTIVSSDGPEVTIIDGEGTHRVFLFLMPNAIDVRGFTITNGFADNNGGAVRVDLGADVTMQNCIFSNNVSNYAGAAIFMRNSGSSLYLTDCEFIDNYGKETGAISTMEPTLLRVDRCLFTGNRTDLRSACMYIWGATADISNSVFFDNSSGDVSGGIAFSAGNGSVWNNTFYKNESPNYATIYTSSSDVVIWGNIIAGDTKGYGLCAPDYIDHTCNLFWNNKKGDLVPGLDPDPTEIFDNPLFCRPGKWDLSIAYDSPAAPENNDCGILIGALEPACRLRPGPSEETTVYAALEEPTLHQNSPNPFNPSTRIAFFLPEPAHVTIDIYDVQGRLVSRLVDGLVPRGEQVVDWNGDNSFGRPVGSGVYFCRLTTGREVLTRKMLLLR